MESLYDWYTSAQNAACIFNETSFLDRGEIAGMTDDALHLNWVFEKSFMLVLLSLEVITNNDIELAFSHLWSQGIKDILLRNHLSS